MDDTDRQPWDKRDGETARAYEVFCIYLEMGPERTHEAVREELGRPPGYTRHLERWSSEHDWVDRAAAHDEYMAEKRRQEYEEEMTTGLSHAGARVRKLKDLHDRLEHVAASVAPDAEVRIDVDTAMSRVANRLNIPKGSVKRRVILPLERQRVGGEQIVEPNWGVLVVRQPDEIADLARTVRTDGGARDA